MSSTNRHVGGVFLICLVAVLFVASISAPAGARGAAISDVQPGDTIFVYEEGLDLSALRNAATGNPVTALQRFTDDNTAKGLIAEIPVPDDTDFDLIDASVGGNTGLYYAYSQADGLTGNRVYVRYPEVSIEAVLASPNHADRITGITIPVGTPIALRVVSPFVGTDYIAGTTHASVDIVVTTPGGAELTSFGGTNLANLPVTSPQFYTDDPGVGGPIVLDRLEEGAYQMQARWRTPQGFADSAADSNIITFSVGDRIGVDVTVVPTTPPTTAVPTTVPVTTAPTITTPPQTTTETPVTTEPTTVPVTTEPTPVPLSLFPVVGALCLAVLAVGRR
ncbi:DUF3821 domain-containing protein [Methanofollis fontis]|nr:DUF3821 domain-containing protein [Methanofollis fontis]